MADGFLIGGRGADHIASELSKGDPRQTIDDIQRQYGLAVPNCVPVLRMLGFLGVSRADTYKYILQRLSEQMTEKVQTMSQKELDAFLEMTFPYVTVEEIKQIPLAILERHPAIPQQFLKELASNQSLYSELPMHVKRQCWQTDPDLFKAFVAPQIDQYIREISDNCPSFELLAAASMHPRRRREQCAPLQQLVATFGTSLEIYQHFLQLLRDRFQSSGDPSYCTLRNDVVMALHDSQIQQLYESDSCHKFAWCLEACIRDDQVESRQIREIQVWFDGLDSAGTALHDVAMILRGRFVFHMMLRAIVNGLYLCYQQHTLPRDDEALCYITQLVSLGLKARQMLREMTQTIPKRERLVVNSLYPWLTTLLVDAEIHKTLSSNPDTETEVPESFTAIPAVVLGLLEDNQLALMIYEQFLLVQVHNIEQPLALHLLGPLKELPPDCFATHSPFLQSLASELIVVKDRPDHGLRSAILNLLVATASRSSFCHEQAIRVLSAFLTKLPAKDLATRLATLTSEGKIDARNAVSHSFLIGHYQNIQTKQGERCPKCVTDFLAQHTLR